MRSFLNIAALSATLLSETGLVSGVVVSDATAEYEAFRQKHGRSEAGDSASFKERLALYMKRKAEVEAHNSRPGVSWLAEVNKFADYTDSEKSALFGYTRAGDWWQNRDLSSSGSSFLELRPSLLHETVDYREKLSSSNFLRSQGPCGSCWAVAAVGALEMHAELKYGNSRPLSFAQLVDCVPNPQHCGGDGGCKGATSELAFEYVASKGLADAGSYSGGKGVCQPAKSVTSSAGFVRLPVNKLHPLLEAVATKGPVVVSVDASGWSMYSSGVYDGCDADAIVNHAVLLVGYGTDDVSGKKYWLIRNSWGKDWGEGGFIRLQRHDSDSGSAGHCGIDRDPQQGVGCRGGPKEIPVCGMCGVLSDSSFPKDVHISSSEISVIQEDADGADSTEEATDVDAA